MAFEEEHHNLLAHMFVLAFLAMVFTRNPWVSLGMSFTILYCIEYVAGAYSVYVGGSTFIGLFAGVVFTTSHHNLFPRALISMGTLVQDAADIRLKSSFNAHSIVFFAIVCGACLATAGTFVYQLREEAPPFFKDDVKSAYYSLFAFGGGLFAAGVLGGIFWHFQQPAHESTFKETGIFAKMLGNAGLMMLLVGAPLSIQEALLNAGTDRVGAAFINVPIVAVVWLAFYGYNYMEAVNYAFSPKSGTVLYTAFIAWLVQSLAYVLAAAFGSNVSDTENVFIALAVLSACASIVFVLVSIPFFAGENPSASSRASAFAGERGFASRYERAGASQLFSPASSRKSLYV